MAEGGVSPRSHVRIDRRFGLIRTWLVTDAAAHYGARLREGLIDPDNTASDVWADTAHRSDANEALLASIGKVSLIHRCKPKSRPMPKIVGSGINPEGKRTVWTVSNLPAIIAGEPPSPVSEPGPLALLGLGPISLGLSLRRRLA